MLITGAFQRSREKSGQDLEIMFNNLINDYDNVNLAFIWDIVHQDLPIIVTELTQFFPFIA